MLTPISKRITPDTPLPEEAVEQKESTPIFAEKDLSGEKELTPKAVSGEQPSPSEMQHLQALRQGPLAAVPLPAGPVSKKSLEEIKRLLFPNIDIEKSTPQELVTYLLVNHSMDMSQAHNWIEFLAESQSVLDQ